MRNNRRQLLAAASLLVPWLAHSARANTRALPGMTEGPFYPPSRWRGTGDWDADLTINGSRAPALGEHLGLHLQVADTGGQLIDDVEVEIWQCDALAAYRHPAVPASEGRYDPGFQGFGGARTGRDGGLRFRTIRPVAYPGRTPHIHVKLRHPSFGELTSQLFVAGEPGNARDFLWRRLDASAQASLAMVLAPAGSDGLHWQARHRLTVPA